MTSNVNNDTVDWMRISQLQSLSTEELSLLLYVVNVIDRIRPPNEITKNILLSIKPEILSWKLAQQESKLTEHGKLHFKSLMTKLNRNPMQDVIDDMNNASKTIQLYLQLNYDNTTNTTSTQSEFSL